MRVAYNFETLGRLLRLLPVYGGPIGLPSNGSWWQIGLSSFYATLLPSEKLGNWPRRSRTATATGRTAYSHHLTNER
jgi:hypothetical protein